MTIPGRLNFILVCAAVFLMGCKEKKPVETRKDPSAPGRKDLVRKSPLPASGEGMWPWADLGKMNEQTLIRRGLKMKLSELWTPGKGGLALAVTGLRGCTASFVSKDGLMITNHHCAFTAIQRNSSPKRDLLKDGFVARKRSEELDGHGVTVLVFKHQKDVTAEIIGKMPPGLSDYDTARHIERREKSLVAGCEEKTDTRCLISRENNGLRFLLLENLQIRDVRLVAAPPRGLGEFGGEVDNWRWPRHTMDFALLRAYVGKDGTPKAYSPANVPFKPKRFLKVNPKGINESDFIMVLGRPYRTARYVTSGFLRNQLEWYYPARESLFAEWIGVLEKTAKEIPASRLPTSSRLKGLNNGLTHARGMVTGLKRRQLLRHKRKLERDWRNRAKGDGITHKALEDYHRKTAAGRDRDLMLRYLLYGVFLFRFARTITKWAQEQNKPDPEREPGYQERDRQNRMDRLKHAQLSLHVEADKRVLIMFLRRFGKLPARDRIKHFDKALGGKYDDATLQAFVNRLYAGTRLADLRVRVSLFKTKSYAALRKERDSMIRLALDLTPALDGYDRRRKERTGALYRLRRPYLKSLIRFTGKRFYPDANASPRVTFAVVSGYTNAKGMRQKPFTMLNGLIRKHTGKTPFNAPANVVAAARAGNRGPYVFPAVKDVPICFLSNADTTGGNSGSPALDGHGRLVGLNFDRVYENIAGDFGYSRKDSRNIMVDVRSILWYLDRVLKAKHILGEMMSGK